VRRERAPRGRGRRAGASLPPGFGTIWLTVALDLVGFGIILPILPLYGERFGASPVVIGLLVAAFSAAQFVFAPLLGRLSDRIGRKPVILVSLFGTAVGSLITGLAWAVWVLFLGRIIDGASGASVSVAQGAVTDLAPPPERPRLLGLLGAAFGVGFVLGPALGGLAAVVGERVPFFVAAFVAFVNALVAMRRLPETHPRFRTDATVTAWSSGVWPAATAEVADAKPDPRRRHDLVDDMSRNPGHARRQHPTDEREDPEQDREPRRRPPHQVERPPRLREHLRERAWPPYLATRPARGTSRRGRSRSMGQHRRRSVRPRARKASPGPESAHGRPRIAADPLTQIGERI